MATKNTTWNQKISSLNGIKHDVLNIFRYAKKEHQSHEEILKRIKERVYDSERYKTLPKYIKSEVAGYISANFDSMYELLEWVHWYDGKFVGKELPYSNGFKQDLINESSHVYKGTQDKY